VEYLTGDKTMICDLVYRGGGRAVVDDKMYMICYYIREV